jgi:hypothetical protein
MNLKDSSPLFLPLDIPPIPNKKIIIENFERSLKSDYVWWNMEVIRGERNLAIPLGSKDYSWAPTAKTKYPDLLNWIDSYFPIKKFFYVHLARATVDVKPHVDENYVERPFAHHMTILPELKYHLVDNEPVGYRFIVSGCRSNFYISDNYDPLYKDSIPHKKYYCSIPNTSDAFLIRNSKVAHGVDRISEDAQRITGFILGEVDIKAHQELITRSSKRFQSEMILYKDIT